MVAGLDGRRLDSLLAFLVCHTLHSPSQDSDPRHILVWFIELVSRVRGHACIRRQRLVLVAARRSISSGGSG